MVETPFEISLTLNAISQILDSTSPPYCSTAAVAPSSRKEKFVGYDVKLPFLKSQFLQFKRPYILEEKNVFSFHTDHSDQLETLQRSADLLPRTVFYALPLVKTDSNLDKTLNNTLFLKVECLEADTTRVRITCENSSKNGLEISKVRAKIQNKNWYDLSHGCWFKWEQIHRGLISSSSGIEPWIEEEDRETDWEPVGVVLKKDGQPVIHPDCEKPVRETIETLVSNSNLDFDDTGMITGMFAR